ncbi:MAG: hypothetical protein AB8G11_12920 [Saprospiraceae bacterium]
MEKFANLSTQNLAKKLQGNFVSKDDKDIIIVRQNDVQIDHIGFNLTLTSKIVWINDTQYNLVLEDVSDQNAPIGIKVGDVMTVTVTEVTNDYYIANCAFNGHRNVMKLWFA